MRYAKSNLAGTVPITNADVYSSEVDLSQMYGFCFQAVWADGGSLSGSVKLQATVDGTNWSDITGTSVTVSGSSSTLWNVNGSFYMKVRAKFTYSAGAGSIVFWESSKGP